MSSKDALKAAGIEQNAGGAEPTVNGDTAVSSIPNVDYQPYTWLLSLSPNFGSIRPSFIGADTILEPFQEYDVQTPVVEPHPEQLPATEPKALVAPSKPTAPAPAPAPAPSTQPPASTANGAAVASSSATLTDEEARKAARAARFGTTTKAEPANPVEKVEEAKQPEAPVAAPTKPLLDDVSTHILPVVFSPSANILFWCLALAHIGGENEETR